MKLRRHLAGASFGALLTASLGIGSGSPAAADTLIPNHRVTVSGTMTLNDDESWPSSDEHGVYAISGSTWVSHSVPQRSIRIERCVGGEVRGVLYVDVQLYNTDQIRVSPTFYLYEGTSCSTNDLDGLRRGTPTFVSRGGWLRWGGLRASNTAERTPDDWGLASFTVTHVR